MSAPPSANSMGPLGDPDDPWSNYDPKSSSPHPNDTSSDLKQPEAHAPTRPSVNGTRGPLSAPSMSNLQSAWAREDLPTDSRVEGAERQDDESQHTHTSVPSQAPSDRPEDDPFSDIHASPPLPTDGGNDGNGNADASMTGVNAEEDEEDEEAFVYQPGTSQEVDEQQAVPEESHQDNAADDEEDEEEEEEVFNYTSTAGNDQGEDAGVTQDRDSNGTDAVAHLLKSTEDQTAPASPSSSTAPLLAPPDDPLSRGQDAPGSHPLEAPQPSEEAAPTPAAAPAAPTAPPAPIDYARLHHLCVAGALEPLQRFFAETMADPPEGAGVSAFALANEPNPASGLMPIHYAAKEGKTELLKWLVEDVGALVEIEDREGETALHKAALAGKLPALTYLLSAGANADAADGDGWTPLHNACSRGYLDIVKHLVENAGASPLLRGGRGDWTPLMNAASNGHLPVVRFLTAKHHVDPFQRNAAGETAYDVAAASFEMYICEVLEKYEAERWSALKFAAGPPRGDRAAPGQGAYNPLYLHTTVPAMIHQNERLDTRLSTLAVHGAKPRWSGTGAGRPHKPDRRAPGTMPPGPLSTTRTRHAPMRREDVQLPNRKQPYKLRLPSRAHQAAAARRAGTETASTPTPQSVLEARRGSSASLEDEPSHFWLSEWQIDRTHPHVDPVDGWQYAQSFDAPEDQWSAKVPPPLARLLEGKGLSSAITRAISAGHLPGPGQSQSPSATGTNGGEHEATATGWVRRRRWIRVMRRRLDIEFGDELEAAELSQASATAAGLHAEMDNVANSTAEQAALLEAQSLGPDASYVDKARALAGKGAREGATPADAMGEDPVVIRGRITRLELAISELRSHAFEDEDVDRRSSAEDLLKEFTLQLGQLRQAGDDGGDDEDDEDEDDDDDDFVYPNSFKDSQSVITRIAPPGSTAAGTDRPSLAANRHSSAASVFGAPTVDPSEAGTTLVSVGNQRRADLARATEFRVPTNDAPNTVVVMSGSSSGTRPLLEETSLMPVWERDEAVAECRGCEKRFTFFTRKHHCRRCGRIFCADCSSHRVQLSADELVIDPGVPEMLLSESVGPSRVCASCNAERQLPEGLRTPRGADRLLHEVAGRGGSGGARRGEDTPLSEVTSRASELNECPVCNATLATLGPQEAQEEHVRICLENGGGGSTSQGGVGRYLVYRLPADSPIMGRECVICLEELDAGQSIARLPCLCFFHRNCIDSWLARGRSCPTHAR